MTLLILGLCFGLIYGIYAIQETIISTSEAALLKESTFTGDKIKIYLLSFIGSFFIVFVNTVLMVSIKLFSGQQKLPTLTHLSSSIA